MSSLYHGIGAAPARKTVNNSVVAVKTNDGLEKVTEGQFLENSAQVLGDADRGVQTAILAEDGKTIRSVLGLNGFRYLPNPDPDPLDELLVKILGSSAGDKS